MLPDQEDRLTNGGDCPDHFHSSDRVRTHDDADLLVSLESYVEVGSGSTTVRPGTDYVLADTSAGSANVELPNPALGLAVTIVKKSASNLVNVSSPTRTVNGAASVSMGGGAYSSAKFKALGGNYYTVA